MPNSLSIVFAGTPDFAARHLQALLNSEHKLLAVYTQPDRPAGRGKKLTPSPVKTLALDHGLDVQQPESLKDPQAQQILANYECDVMVVVAYGLLLPKAVLEIPRHGCINVHGSILPRWRGAAPIQRAIEAGDSESGVTIMQMDEGLDTGDMLVKAFCPITATETSGSLHDKLSEIGPSALLDALQQIANGELHPEQQDNATSCYAKKIDKHEANVDWTLPAVIIDRQIRAFNPFPISFTHFKSERLRIHNATVANESTSSAPGTMVLRNHQVLVQCGEGALALQRVQLPGKKAVDIKEFINGFANSLQNPIQLTQADNA